MQSNAKDVSAYIVEASPERQEYLNKLRAICREMLVGYQEGMQYGMPVYTKDGVGEVGFANQKNYISLYILKEEVVNANRVLLAGLHVGKGCIRYANLKKMNFEIIRKLLADTVASRDNVC